MNLNLISDDIQINNAGDSFGIFFKGVYLKDNIMAFMNYWSSLTNSLEINIGYVQNNSSFISKLSYRFTDHNFKYNSELNDFVKVSENRLAYIGKSLDFDSSFGIILFDIYNNVQNMKIRVFYFTLNEFEITKELEAIIYNDYLSITSTVKLSLETNDNDNVCFSIFFIFGYVNGTDADIDIIKYLSGNNNANNNLVSDLTENIIVENNIFGYEIVKNQIKLVYIPECLLFYNKNEDNKLLKNNDILELNYLLNYNESFKDNKSNYFEYQNIISEADYDIFNNHSTYIINCSTVDSDFIDERDYYIKERFYGRTNTLYFKVNLYCHEYCQTCYESGTSEIAQKCLTCKQEYSYFYPKNFTSNCIPEGKYYDFELGQMIECNNSNSKFYIDDKGKTICFKNTQDCPYEYPFLIQGSNECSNIRENNNNNLTFTEILFKNSSLMTPLIINNCTYENLIIGKCNLIFNDDGEAYNYMIEIILKYDIEEEKSIYITTERNTIFELTTSNKEKNELNGIIMKDNLTIIDFDKCEKILRDSYDIYNNTSLILLKSENLNNIPSKKNVQYEIYESLNKTKLNLSLCEGNDINLYIPIELHSHTQKLYDELNKSGYDLFNINDKFYQDICTPYKSENDTDILLSDRINDIYYKNNNLTLCQENCEYSHYIAETKLLKCKCKVNTDLIDYKNKEKFTPKKIYESFYEVLKYSNYKIIKCYKLIIKKNPFSLNLGSTIVLIIFISYLLFLIIFAFKGITSLKLDIVKTIEKNQKPSQANLNKTFTTHNKSFDKQKKGSKSFHQKRKKGIQIVFPPKRNVIKNNIVRKNDKNKKNINNLSIENDKIYIFNNSENKTFGNLKRANSKSIEDKNNNFREEIKILDDFELNDLDYLEAKNIDKRSFISIYWSILRREHRIIFTFFINNDYNLFLIKIMRFLFLICTDMAMNVIFFTDESMHKIYLNYGKYDFFQQIPQSIYSLIISQIIEVFISFLSLTDKHYYQIKNIDINNSEQYEKKYLVFQVLRCIKFKLLGFFVFTFLFFGFYWYLIACFCQVYNNTQIIFIKDFLVSYIAGLIYPFILYLFPPLLRIISLRAFKNINLAYIYKLSDIIPIF